MKKKVLTSLVVATTAFAAFSREAHFLPRTYSNTPWGTPSVWSDGYVPTNAEDVVYITDGPDDETNTTRPTLNGRIYPNTNTDISPLTLNIDSFGYGAWGFHIYCEQNRNFVMRDAANCFCSWHAYSSAASFTKRTGTPGPLVLNNVYGGYGFTFIAPAVEDTIEIKSLYQSGLSRKKGKGTLKVCKPAGKPQFFELSEGTLELGHEDVCDGLPTNRFFHIDASLPETLQTQVVDGRTFVTNWLDCDGNSRHAWMKKDSLPNAGAPFVSAEKSPSGLPLVSFGGYSLDTDDQAKHGPAAALWLGNQSGVKEIFQVVKLNGANGWGCYVSQFYCDGYRLLSNVDSLMTSSWDSNPNLNWQGPATARLNGVPCGQDCHRNPNKLGIVSAYSEHDSGGWYLCFNYSDNKKFGGYSIAEIVAYGRVLTESERQGVIRYLSKKWFSDDESRVFDGGVVAVKGNDTAVSVAEGNRADIHGIRVFDSKRTLTKTGAGTLALEQTYPATATITVKGGEVAWFQSVQDAATPQPADNPYLHLDASQTNTFVYGEDGTSVTMWKDCRATCTVCATSPASATKFPYVTENAANGLATLDFGTTYETNNPYLTIKDLSGAKRGKSIHVFYVWESLTKDKDHPPHALGGGDWSYLRKSSSNIAGSYYDAVAEIQGGLWRLDGEPTPREGEAYGQGVGEVQVVSGSFTGLYDTSLVGACRTSSSQNKGGVRIAEVLIYTHRLSESEKRQTEAYLLKKWKGVSTHPALRTTVKSITFDEGVEPKLIVENGSREFETVSGEGTLAKAGAGKAAVATVNGRITALDLQGGVLEMAGDYSAPNEITIRIDKDGVISGKLSVTGALTLPDNGTLRVIYESEGTDAPKGNFDFIAAQSITGGLNWSVVTESKKLSKRHLGFVTGETSASLSLQPRGLMVIVK